MAGGIEDEGNATPGKFLGGMFTAAVEFKKLIFNIMGNAIDIESTAGVRTTANDHRQGAKFILTVAVFLIRLYRHDQQST